MDGPSQAWTVQVTKSCWYHSHLDLGLSNKEMSWQWFFLVTIFPEKGTQKGKYKNRNIQNHSAKIEKSKNRKVKKCRNREIYHSQMPRFQHYENEMTLLMVKF